MAGWKDGCKVFLPTILAFSDGLEPNEKMITYLHSWVLPQKGIPTENPPIQTPIIFLNSCAKLFLISFLSLFPQSLPPLHSMCWTESKPGRFLAAALNLLPVPTIGVFRVSM